jgi:hypothetical protein
LLRLFVGERPIGDARARLSHWRVRAQARLQAEWPRLVLGRTPVHASWLNQIEIYLSIVQRQVLTPNDFPNLTAVKDCPSVSRPLRAGSRSVPVDVHPSRFGGPAGEAHSRAEPPPHERHKNTSS